MLPSDSFVSCLDSLLGYSTREFQALQLVVFGVWFFKKSYVGL